MVKLPDYTALGERDPRASSIQPSIPSSDPRYTAVERLGGTLQGVGNELIRQQREQQNVVDLAAAETAKTQAFQQFALDHQYDNDYSTLPQRAAAFGNKSINGAAAKIRDPKMRERWLAQSQEDAARFNGSIAEHAGTLEHSTNQNSFEASAEGFRRTYVDPHSTPEQKAKALAELNGMEATGFKSGLLNPDQKTAFHKKYIEDAGLSRGALAIKNGQGQDVLGSGPVTIADIPKEGAAFLNTIAGLESGAGGYNIINGGQKFSDFSHHPNTVGPGGTTTAAGRYQMVYGTWIRAAKALGLKDFSPENQDRAAWWNAQFVYKQKTGRDLTADLQSKDANVVAGIRRALAPSEWTGLQHIGDGAFVSAVSSGKTTFDHGVDLANAPDYVKSLSPEQQQSLLDLYETEQHKQSAEDRTAIEIATQNGPAAMQSTGAYTGYQPSATDFTAAYGPQEGAQKYAAFQASMVTAGQIHDFQTQPNDQIMAAVRAAEPTSTGDNAFVEAKRYSAMAEAANQTMTARRENPAGYVMHAFPNVQQAWNAVENGTGNIQEALAATGAAETQLGIPPPQQALLPTDKAASIVTTFKDVNQSTDNRIAAVMSPFAATNDPGQQESIKEQLIKAGLPEIADGAIRASMRPNDQGASRRLWQAALTNVSELPGKVEESPDSIKQGIQNGLMGPGSVGDVYYGLANGTAGNFTRANRDNGLLSNYVNLRLREGKDLSTAVDMAKRDLFGDVQPLQDAQTHVLIDGDANLGAYRAGFEALKPQIRAKLEAAKLPTAAPQGTFAGQAEPGNIDLAKRPIARNADGSISTVRSMSFEEDGKEILVPTVSPEGKILSDQQAIDLYHQTGQFLGKFDTPDHANAYAQALHQAQDRFYSDRASGGAAVLDASAQKKINDVMATGWMQNLGNGFGWVEPMTSTFVAGPDGKPIIFSDEDVLKAAGDRTSAGSVRTIGARSYGR